MGLQAGGGTQRYLVALPGCSIQRTWHCPWGEGGGGSAFSSPRRASGRAAGRQGGPTRELMRFLGEILADESGLAAVSVRPACHCEHTLSQVGVTRRGAVTRFGAKEHTLATTHAQSRGAASRTTVPRGSCGRRREL